MLRDQAASLQGLVEVFRVSDDEEQAGNAGLETGEAVRMTPA